MSMIHLKPKSGLCNRMQAIDSGIALAERLDRPLKVYWVADQWLNCRFDQLWEKPTHHLVEIIECKRRPLKFWRTHLWMRRFPLDWLPGSLVFHSNRNEALKQFDFRHVGAQPLLIESYSRFAERKTSYRELTPLPILQKRIDDATSRFDQHTIGVHIRRTDHEKSIAYSPDSAFIAQMQSEINSDPSTTFYLATDDLEVKHAFRNTFGPRLCTAEISVARTTPEGMQDALVELYTLSKTSKILGSYWSSYSKVAAELGNLALTRVVSTP